MTFARLLSIGVLLPVLPAVLLAQSPAPSDTSILARIRDEGFSRSKVLEIAIALSDIRGPLAGSPRYRGRLKGAIILNAPLTRPERSSPLRSAPILQGLER